jgi:hypothetical protein
LVLSHVWLSFFFIFLPLAVGRETAFIKRCWWTELHVDMSIYGVIPSCGWRLGFFGWLVLSS